MLCLHLRHQQQCVTWEGTKGKTHAINSLAPHIPKKEEKESNLMRIFKIACFNTQENSFHMCISHPCAHRISFWLYCVMMTMIFEFIRNYIILTWHYYLLAVGSLATLLFPFSSCLIECCLDFYFKKTNLFERRW